MNKKNIILIAIVVLIVFLVGLYIFITSKEPAVSTHINTNQTDNSLAEGYTREPVSGDLDMFMDNKLNISFTMHHDWYVRTAVDSLKINGVDQVVYQDNMVSIESTDKPLYKSTGKGPEDEGRVSLSGTAVQFIRTSFTANSLSEYFDQAYGRGQWTSRKEKIADNIEAEKVDFTGGMKNYSTEYYFVYKNWLYHIGIMYVDVNPSPLAEAMLSSLKLLN